MLAHPHMVAGRRSTASHNKAIMLTPLATEGLRDARADEVVPFIGAEQLRRHTGGDPGAVASATFAR